MTSLKLIHFSLATLVGILMLSLLSSCTKHNSGGGEASFSPLEEFKLEGHYIAKFKALNASVSGATYGKGKIQVMGNHFSVALDIKDSPADASHYQAIYNLSKCPSETIDANHDGFIDSVELNQSAGGTLIPLDGDLSSQEAGTDILPYSNDQGAYVYYQETSLSQLISDLYTVDLNIEDEFIKWDPAKTLLLDDKIIVIHGVPEDVYLPGSVQGLGTQSERKTLPIACAEIDRGGPADDSEIEEVQNP